MKRHRKGFILGYIVALIPVFLLALLVVERDTWSETHFSLADQGRSQAFYLAESGIAIAWDAFAASNFKCVTHQGDGTTTQTGATQLNINSWNLPSTSTWSSFNITRAANGWLSWSSASSNFSYTNSGVPESWQVQVYFPNNGNAVKITCVAQYGQYTASHTVFGNTQPSLNYALFSDGSLSEFVRGANQNIGGNVHANGPLYFRPSGTSLVINATEVSSQGLMIRSKDAWGRADTGGTVTIEQTNTSNTPYLNPGVLMNGVSQGGDYDSNSANWTSSGSQGALQMWNGIVKDQKLGGGYVEPPPVETLMPGGYYDSSANIHINSGTTASYLSTTTFWNESETETVNCINLDIAALHAANPSWGPASQGKSPLIIYATTPIRIINASQVFGPITIASEAPIYTKGDFNMVQPTQAAVTNGQDLHQPAAIITSDRIWYLSDGWSDAASISSHSETTGKTPSHTPLTTADNATSLEVNGLLVDGAPTVTERNYYGNASTNPYYNPTDLNNPNGAFANSDVFLENLSGWTFTKMGSIAHLQNAHMAALNQSNVKESDPTRNGSILTSWIINSYYNPPHRNYLYDTNFSNQNFQPPGVPVVFNKTFWQVNQYL